MWASRQALAMLGQALVLVVGASWLVRTSDGFVDRVLPLFLIVPMVMHARSRHARGLSLELPGAFLASFAAVILCLHASLAVLTGWPLQSSGTRSFALLASPPMALLAYGAWKAKRQRRGTSIRAGAMVNAGFN
jgi:hypothetical protein